MLQPGDRLVHKSHSSDDYANSWEVCRIDGDNVLFGGPGNLDSLRKISYTEATWDWRPFTGLEP